MNHIQGRSDLEAWRKSKPVNYFHADPLFRDALRIYLGFQYSPLEPELDAVGRLSAGALNDLAVESNRDENLPVLRSYDHFGSRAEEVHFHPSYHQLGSLIWNTGIVSVLSKPGNEITAGAIAYLIAQNGEAGHLCPVACTAGAVKLIQQLGSDEQKAAYLPGLLERDYSKRLHAAQFLTEVQGGSDVGANSCVAVPTGSPGTYRIHGEKWFCSVMDAGLFVITARPEGAPEGTRGLGLFLVPRFRDDQINGFSIRRLKQKLGTRSMATGETEFDGALAEQIGPLEDGFKNAVRIVLDTSRIYNAVSACGILRRAYVEARTFAEHRKAFGNPILQYPLVLRTLARIRSEACAALATTFRILQMTDNAVTGSLSEDSIAARRIHVMINKYWTSLQTSEMVRCAIEILGGNGTIEDFSVLPRLYRDAIVLESWEGTHNTLCLQVLRDFRHRGMHSAWCAEIRETIRILLPAKRERAVALATEVQNGIDRVLACPDSEAQLLIRPLIDRMCILHAYTSMVLIAGSSQFAERWTDVAEYFLLRHTAPGDLMDSSTIDLEHRICLEL